MNDYAVLSSEVTASTYQAPSILFVDDEPNILQSLRRLFRPLGYQISIATSGAQGLEMLAAQPFDVVMSDMRMPEMNGAQFLTQVRQRWPDTMRLLLTGYADMSSTIDAINHGQIFRYISKPWQDEEIQLVVRQALEMKHLISEKKRLERLTQEQNDALKKFNATLEAKVKARTAELEQTMDFLELANASLKKSFINSVKIFSSFIELRAGSLAGHSRRVADVAKSISLEMKLAPHLVQDIVLAGHLHDVGKIGVPDTLLNKPFLSLTPEERNIMIKHPAKGQAVLMAMEQLQGASLLIRHHHERYDGEGFPDGLKADDIPLGARILALANDFDALQNGTLQAKSLSRQEAIQTLHKNAGKRYDPAVVEAFLRVVGEVEVAPPSHEIELTTPALEPGMKLARDIVTRDGVLLLASDHVLDARIIEQIRHYERSDGRNFAIYVVNTTA